MVVFCNENSAVLSRSNSSIIQRRSHYRRKHEFTAAFAFTACDFQELSMHQRPYLHPLCYIEGLTPVWPTFPLTPTCRRALRNTRRHVGIDQNANGNVCVYCGAALGCYKGWWWISVNTSGHRQLPPISTVLCHHNFGATNPLQQAGAGFWDCFTVSVLMSSAVSVILVLHSKHTLLTECGSGYML